VTQTREMVSTAGGRHGMSPATLNEHEADTFGEHVFMNGLSPCSSLGGAVIVRLWPAAPKRPVLLKQRGVQQPPRSRHRRKFLRADPAT